MNIIDLLEIGFVSGLGASMANFILYEYILHHFNRRRLLKIFKFWQKKRC